MKATITHISDKGNHAKVTVEKLIGPVVSQISGWMKLANKDAKVGDTFDLPEDAVVDSERRGDYVALVIM